MTDHPMDQWMRSKAQRRSTSPGPRTVPVPVPEDSTPARPTSDPMSQDRQRPGRDGEPLPGAEGLGHGPWRPFD